MFQSLLSCVSGVGSAFYNLWMVLKLCKFLDSILVFYTLSPTIR